MRFECKCGKKSKTFKKKLDSISDRESKSGFKLILNGCCDPLWMCPECYEKAQKLAIQLYEVVGRKAVFFSAFIGDYIKEIKEIKVKEESSNG